MVTYCYCTECQTLPSILSNGRVSISSPKSSNNIFGTIISYLCEDPYALNVENSSFYCRENGTWNHAVDPECILSNYYNIFFI